MIIVANRKLKTTMSRMRTFSYQNRKLQVMASPEPDGWTVRLYFEDGRRASQLSYRVSFEVPRIDDRRQGQTGDFVEQLMVLMQGDVESGRLKLSPN
jgi:hypothetical protein